MQTRTKTEADELNRLGRRACSSFCFPEARDGVFGDDSDELGELE